MSAISKMISKMSSKIMLEYHFLCLFKLNISAWEIALQVLMLFF